MPVIEKGVKMVLEVGTIAPDFTLVDQHGEEITLSEVLEEQAVALVFFPLAFSGVCTGELCELRDNLSMFEDQKVRLFAISVDSKFALAAWAKQEGYEFSLLSDFWPHGKVAKDYGVLVEEAGIASRATIIIGQDGKIVASFENSPADARNLGEYREALSKLS